MSDFILLAGVLLCLLSVVWAVVQLARVQPPRAAAIMLVFGIALLFLGAWAQPDPFEPAHLIRAWDRVTGAGADTTG